MKKYFIASLSLLSFNSFAGDTRHVAEYVCQQFTDGGQLIRTVAALKPTKTEKAQKVVVIKHDLKTKAETLIISVEVQKEEFKNYANPKQPGIRFFNDSKTGKVSLSVFKTEFGPKGFADYYDSATKKVVSTTNMDCESDASVIVPRK